MMWSCFREDAGGWRMDAGENKKTVPVGAVFFCFMMKGKSSVSF